MPRPRFTPEELDALHAYRRRLRSGEPLPPLPAVDPAQRTPPGPPTRIVEEESAAFADWLGHLAAGHIAIR